MSIPTTSVAQALRYIAPGFGLTVEDNRAELIRHLNVIRGLLYSSYARYEIAVDRKICLPLESYCLDCQRCSCPDTYKGVTLPYDAASTESLKIYDHSIKRNSGYKDIDNCTGCLEAWDVIGRVPTQKEIGCTTCGLLGFYASNSEDNGKTVKVTFLDGAGAERTETVTLPGTTKLGASKVLEVVLPENRSGKISVYLKGERDDEHLSTYHRSETCPNYPRIRLNTVCTSYELSIVYAREFFEVYDDDEVVETANPYVLQELAQYVRINGRMNNSQTDRGEAEIHRRQAEQAIQGLIQRSEGESKSVVLDIKGTLSQRSGLATRRRWGGKSWARRYI